MGYRDSKYILHTYIELPSEKIMLGRKIDERVLIECNKGKHYQKIRNKNSSYYKEFIEIYNQKCGYCGINIEIESNSSFQIDHFVNRGREESTEFNDFDNINNLVFCCRKCNTRKSGFDVIKEGEISSDLIFPDKESIKFVFYRNESYKIEISENYKSNILVNEFYDKLSLGDYSRRLDYLLLNLYDFISKNSDNEHIYFIKGLALDLCRIRNRTV
ncbi:HNH endonuclease signature motif containing protein [Erysipelothrix rhusiopathiae]|nr:HNH endonuclease signature motif containing protein [Erysipelothrix rhusiopathiae]